MARILIAEDDPLIGSMLEKGFRANGFSTCLADDGVQAQRLALTEEFDFMILDMGLPERNGLQVLQELRARGKTLPVLVLTGRREPDAATFLEAGADDYMTKPFRFAELVARVRTRLRAVDELDRMRRMADGLRLLAEIERPGFLRPKSIDLGTFAHELAARARVLGSRRWGRDDTAEGVVYADRERLAEAVMNLVQNAVQHTREDETVAIGTALSEGECRLWVRDTGTGIAPSDQARIFKWGTGNHHSARGDGLGLAIVAAIAAAHGGRVEVESRPALGSTFTIVVPRHLRDRVEHGPDPDR